MLRLFGVVSFVLWSTMLAFWWLYLLSCSNQCCCLVDDSCCGCMFLLTTNHSCRLLVGSWHQPRSPFRACILCAVVIRVAAFLKTLSWRYRFLPFSFLLWPPTCPLEVKPRYNHVGLFVVVPFVPWSTMLAFSWLHPLCCGQPCWLLL